MIDCAPTMIEFAFACMISAIALIVGIVVGMALAWMANK